MSSSAVRNSPLRFVFSLLALVIGAAAEECLPKLLSVGFPVLLVEAQLMASRGPLVAAAAFAMAAGALEESISSLPAMTSVSYFLAVAVLARRAELPRAAVVLSYPAYQLWLRLWVSGAGGNVFQRLLVSLPIGVATALAVGAILLWTERKAGINEAG